MTSDRWGKILPHHVTAMARLTKPQCVIYACMLAHTPPDGSGLAWPSVARIMDMTGYDRRMVQRGLAGLRASGALEVAETENGGVTKYRVIASPDTAPVERVTRYRPGASRIAALQASRLTAPPASPDAAQKREVKRAVEESSEKNRAGTAVNPSENPNTSDPQPALFALPSPAVTPPPVPVQPPAPKPTAADKRAAKAAEKARAAEAQRADVEKLHAWWQQATGRDWGLNDDRARMWRAVLSAAGGDMNRAGWAIRGLAASDFHMGRDPRSLGKLFIEPRVISANLEKFAEEGRATGKARGSAHPPPIAEWERQERERVIPPAPVVPKKNLALSPEELETARLAVKSIIDKITAPKSDAKALDS